MDVFELRKVTARRCGSICSLSTMAGMQWRWGGATARRGGWFVTRMLWPDTQKRMAMRFCVSALML